MDRVRGVVVGINDGRWRNSPARGDVGVVNRLKSAHPSILCEVVVVHAKASAQDGISRGSERVRSSDTRSKGPPIVIRRGGDERRLLWIQRDKKRVLSLRPAGGGEKSEARVVTQAIAES